MLSILTPARTCSSNAQKKRSIMAMSRRNKAARTLDTPRHETGMSLDVDWNSFRISQGKMSQKTRKGGKVQKALRKQEPSVGLSVSQLTSESQSGSVCPHSQGRYNGSEGVVPLLPPLITVSS